MVVTKVFMTGRSQAVRIPKAFRFRSQVVTVRREGDSLILSPPANSAPWEEFFAEHTCPDFFLDRNQTPQKRELFG